MDKIKKIIEQIKDIENPEVISIMLYNLSNGQPDQQGSADFMNAIKVCVQTDNPWDNFFVFENIVDALCLNTVIPGIMTVPPIEDMAVAVSIMKEIKNIEYSEEVKKYIAARAIVSEILWLIPPLDIVNEYLILKEGDAGYELQNDLVKWLSQNKIEEIDPETLQETALDIQLYRLFKIIIAMRLNNIKDELTSKE